MQKQLDKPRIYEIAGKEIYLISKDYKDYFVDFHLAQGCEKVVAKGACNSPCKGECPNDCPLKVVEFQAKENIASGLRKAPDWGRTKCTGGTEVMHVYESPIQRNIRIIEGMYDTNKLREFQFAKCAHCRTLHKETHTWYDCENCLQRKAFQNRIAKLERSE